MTMKTVLISSLLNALQHHLGADCPIHGMTHTSWTPKPDSGQLMGCNPSVPHSVLKRSRMAQAHSGAIRRRLPAPVLILICGLRAPAYTKRSAHLALGGAGGHGGVITFTPR
jgi:hypothetical protein